MNREIKFRFYCPYNKEMYYDDDENYELKIKNGEFSYIPLVDNSYCFYSNITDDLETDNLNIIPMQFTNLYDKNNKEIYEGDIVKHDYKFGNGFGVVAYYAPLFKLDSKKGTCEDFTWEDLEQFEVIGNMYENPELLK